MHTKNTPEHPKVPDSINDVYSKHHAHTCFHDNPIQNIVKLGCSDFLEAQKPLETHIHPNCFEVCYHYKGEQHYIIEQDEFVTRSGNIFITFPNESHGSGNYREERSSLYYLIFECDPDTESFLGLSRQDSIMIRDSLWSCTRRSFPGVRQMHFLLKEIMELQLNNAVMKQARIYSLFIQFFYLLCQCIEESKKPFNTTEAPEDIQKIVAYIETHPYEKYSIEDLAQQIFLSNSQFMRKFKQYMGVSPYDYIIQEKIQTAKNLMKSTDLTITYIASELGFSSSQHFATVFKKYTGKTPSMYRKTI